MGQFRPAVKVWRAAATRLFTLYGIDLLDAVGQSPRTGVARDWLLQWRVSVGPGFLAVRQSAILHTSYVVAFCWFTISFGLLLAKRVTSPEISWRIGLYRIVEELKQTLRDCLP